MKAVILAGGLGTRLAEETGIKPKPMVEIGGKPILWHIMKGYASHGVREFIICVGYKGYVIKEYFANYFLHNSDMTFEILEKKVHTHYSNADPWRVTVVDTGEHSMTGGRLRRVRDYIQDDFFFTYGDGVGNVDITRLLEFHRSHGCQATVTATHPPRRFGIMELEGQRVVNFQEKPPDSHWINGGFFVLSPKVLDLLDGDMTVWEDAPLRQLVTQDQLRAFLHEGFWQPMDTLRDKNYLEDLWAKGAAPWKTWQD
ncbi:MAG: glucose-1-phosphate cytidylyltransferase [Magnetococcales bacterium]|nr:glucose-1-phosphate cytidylyltransferase [Magnetococcales bacterium]NGZ28604.1 glucose-1-phosphate cytidylyltransferase [Magnetococcales bacterium]